MLAATPNQYSDFLENAQLINYLIRENKIIIKKKLNRSLIILVLG